MIEAYLIHLLILIGIYYILAVSLQLSLGYGGLLNLAHLAFFGIGAYALALLELRGVPFLPSLLAAGIIAGFFGWLLAIPTKKLKGEYFALVALGFSFVTYAILMNWTELTNGPFGVAGIPRPEILGINFSGNVPFLGLVIICALIAYLVIRRICRSPLGRVLEATRDDELAAQSLGKKTSKLKSIALTVSALLAGVAGGLFASYVTFIDPGSFTFMNLLPILLIVIIGGLASLPGTVLATIIIVLLPEPLRFIGLPAAILGPVRQIIFASLLLVIISFKPRGFWGKIDLE